MQANIEYFFYKLWKYNFYGIAAQKGNV